MQINGCNIYIDNDFSSLKLYLNSNQYSQIVILVDENTNEFCMPIIENIIEGEATVIEVMPGEANKNLSTCVQIWENLLDARVDRKALFINLGGGVLCDMGGFVATTFKRGINFINIPTSLMAQIDAAVGGKLGVDFEHHKNTIGLFKNPDAVFINPVFLNTLPIEELKSGYAEMIKHGLIHDVNLWNELSQIYNFEKINWIQHIQNALHVKKYIVETDYYEQNIRKTLNYGHTIGHAIESYALASEMDLLHGHVVAVGMICESYISHHQSGLSYEEFNKIVNYLHSIYPKINVKKMDWTKLKMYLHQDKKNYGDNINCTLLKKIGEPIIDQTVNENLIQQSLNFYQSLS